jgi:hypothetical protein
MTTDETTGRSRPDQQDKHLLAAISEAKAATEAYAKK